MFGLTHSVLLGTAISTALFHTLIPDHWLPFVLVARSRGWNAWKTALVSGFSSVVHVALSLTLGWLALELGTVSARAVGESLERASAVLLVLFGLVYAGWAWRKGGHFHPGGRLLHAGHAAQECDGGEGPTHPEHLHYHADEQMIRGAAGPGWLWLALIVGLNPCVLVLPLLLAAAARGPAALSAVSLAYGATTAALMVGLSVGGVVGTRRVRLPGIARHMEPISGLLIALTGVVFWVVG